MNSIDESYKPKPTDAYALSKQEAEIQAEAFVNWFPFMRIASMRIHQVAPLKDVQKEHAQDPETAAKNLWGWVNPQAVARACRLSVEGDKFTGHEGGWWYLTERVATQSQISSSRVAIPKPFKTVMVRY